MAVAVALVSLAIAVRFGNDAAIALESPAPSVSVGTAEEGRLVHGKRLPTRGANFRAYSLLCAMVGRNSVHGAVRDVVLDAYRRLETSRPGTTYVYGECSWPSGGRIRPHLTHRNGLSVDFMVPVRNDRGPAVLSTHAANRFGYAVEFDKRGECAAQKCRVDFDALAAHLDALRIAARERGLRIERVIFAPELHPPLFATKAGASLREALPFQKRPSWVRHDEHYHVDFAKPGDGPGRTEFAARSAQSKGE